MARGAGPLRPGSVAGIGVGAVVLALTAGTLIQVLLRAETPARLGPADWAAIRFTVLQATLSAVLSVALAVPVARALARRRFPGRELVITLMGAPFILPVVVAVLGLLAVFGRAGLVNQALGAAGIGPVSIYGLHGVVLAHVFFNLPLAVRLILQGWLGIPAERFRLAASLNMGPGDVSRWLERPMLREVVPGALLIIFLICLTSFAVALTLGGGPRATTIELAIYQAFRFEFDLGRAAFLGAVQVGLTLAVAAVAFRSIRKGGFGAGLDRTVERWDGRRFGTRIVDAFWIFGAALFLVLPLGMIVAAGVAGAPGLGPSIWAAAGRSVLVALLATVLILGLALPMALTVVAMRPGRGASALEAIGYLGVATSPLVIGTGLFLLLFPWVDPARMALPVTAVVNAVMALPFALRVLVPAVESAEAAYGRLADSLGMEGLARLRWLLLPRLRRPLGFSAGLTAALSMGDLGVIALFADPERATLPLQVFRLMGAYRMDDAAGAALVLLVLSLGVFWLCDRGGRSDAAV